MLDNSPSVQSVVAFTDASFKATKGRRPNKVTGGVLYASEGTLLSGFLMNLAQFSIYGSRKAELLTSILAVALASKDYNLTALHTDCDPSLPKLFAFQHNLKPVKGLRPAFLERAKVTIGRNPVDFKSSSRNRGSVEVAHNLADMAKHLRSGAQAITFDADHNVVYGPTYSWDEMARLSF